MTLSTPPIFGGEIIMKSATGLRIELKLIVIYVPSSITLVNHLKPTKICMLGGLKTPSVRNTVRLEMMFEKEIIKEKA